MAYIDDIYAVVQIAPTGVPTYIRLSQNENGRKMYFAIVGGTIPSGSTATISGTKPDGVVYSASGTITGNTITINEDVQLTAAAGQWDAKLKIINSGQTIATGRIRFVIDADPVAPGSVPSDSQLEGLVAEAEQYAEAARNAAYYGSPLVASTVAGMTDHNRVYVYTGSESGYTAGNWYYWNGSAWTSGGVYNAVAVSTDTSLTIAGKAADSKAAGDRLTAAENDISDVKSDLTQIEEDMTHIGISESVKVALLDCFAHVVWTDEHGQEYYDTLEAALYEEEYPRLEAIFTPGSHIVYADDELSTLKTYLAVKVYEDADDPGTAVPANDYTLSGVLQEGQSVIRVSYDDLSTTFTLTVVDYYEIYERTFPGDVFVLAGSAGLGNQGGAGYEPVFNGAYSPATRASFWVDKGRSGQLPVYNNLTHERDDNTFAIPVPSDATSVTCAITPSTYYVNIRRYLYDESTQTWVDVRAETGWQLGSGTLSLPTSEYDRYISISSKFNSGGTSGDLPTGLTITFE